MIWFHESLKSTQDEMKALAASGDSMHLDAVCALLQTVGRGRHGREWIALPGNLSASIHLKDTHLPLTWIPLWVGLCTARALMSGFPELSSLGGGGILLKWPNDLMIDTGAKLGGILCEKVDSGVIAGIGLNLESSPELQGRKSTSLKALFERCGVERKSVTARIVLESVLSELKREPSVDEVRTEFLRRSFYPPGREIVWKNARTGSRILGRVLGLGSHGELRVEIPGGGSQSLFSEEIEELREKPEAGSDQK
ncbi:MAG: biotin--[acetyl-CoA-carboxylase] ligase [Bdellovibrionales bacterium]|nr:biotin--[acetyl-CoA-carboxylase] ligase [Bdellovibrionales bacterium]